MVLREITEFDAAIFNQPRVLLVRVENMIHMPMNAKCPPLMLVEVLINFLQLKQADN